MKEDSVTISLTRYHQLKDAEEIAKTDAKRTIKDQVNEQIKKLKKSTILIEKRGSVFFNYIEDKIILTDSEAVEKIGEQLSKLQSQIDEKIEEAEKEGIQYKQAYKKLQQVKWYDLLFGVKELKL